MTRTSLMDAKRRRQGTTLMELLVATSVLFLVFASVSAVLISGLSYLRSNQSALDSQRSALLIMNALCREVERTSTIFTDAENGGICFADPYGGGDDPSHGITAQLQSDVFGQLLWQRYVGYYLDVTAKKIYRREAPFYVYPPAAALTAPPPAGPMVCQTPGTPPLQVSWWAAQSTLATKMIADDVCVFNVTNVVVPNPVVGAAGTVSVVNITLEVGDPVRKDYNHYWFRLQTQISPRN